MVTASLALHDFCGLSCSDALLAAAQPFSSRQRQMHGRVKSSIWPPSSLDSRNSLPAKRPHQVCGQMKTRYGEIRTHDPCMFEDPLPFSTHGLPEPPDHQRDLNGSASVASTTCNAGRREDRARRKPRRGAMSNPVAAEASSPPGATIAKIPGNISPAIIVASEGTRHDRNDGKTTHPCDVGLRAGNEAHNTRDRNFRSTTRLRPSKSPSLRRTRICTCL